MGWRTALQQLTDEACEDLRREAMQHLAAIDGHDGLRMTYSTTTYVLAVAPWLAARPHPERWRCHYR